MENPIRIKRRSFLGGMGALALPWAVDPVRAAGGTRPNLLFVLVDQWRFCSFSHGEVNDPLVQTPNFDQFVSEGARWRKAYSTYPLCTPERSILMTGRYAHQTGMMENDLMIPPGNRCLAEVFTEAGYTAHYIGKTHFDGGAKPGFVPPGWRRRGFTTYEGFNRGHNYTSGQTYFSDGGTQLYPTEYEPKYQTDLAIDFMDRNRARPWFCYLSWGPPHGPYGQFPPEYSDYYSGGVIEADRRPNVPAGNPGAGNLEDYFTQCTALDDQFKRLMDYLNETGLDQNTLVVFTSDHGDMHQSHALLNKRLVYEESAHIPLFMRWPERIASGQVPDALIGGVDVMPTLLGLCGLPVPKTCTGLDKSAAVTGGTLPVFDSIYLEGDRDTYAGYDTWRGLVRDDGYKLGLGTTADQMAITDLYNLNADPYELTNLKDDPAYATIKQELYDRLVQWISVTDDTYPEHPPMALNMYTT
jgi:arylsulfatase A-like enzyme